MISNSSSSSSSNVWVEKYRPTDFDNIVLDNVNKTILTNIIETGYFPNLLLYGPPGTGKTTTIINLIHAYQLKLNQPNKELIIHLNASDERGIDIIRSQINQFVNSKNMFKPGMKFVILDEVDYMTKNAQQALKYILQNFTNKARFCLMCNYVSRIDEGLQNEFLRLKFNQLPETHIIHFLETISTSENLNLSQKSLQLIQQLYKSDIRSMINFMQSNQNITEDNILYIIDDCVWDTLYAKIQNKEEIGSLTEFIHNVSYKYNVDTKHMIKDFLNYIIRNKEHLNVPAFFDFVENIMHFEGCKHSYFVHYFLLKLSKLV